LRDAGIGLQDIDAIALTAGPGLIGSLLVGVTFAKGLSAVLDVPLIEVDHLQAHMFAPFADGKGPGFPFLCLLVSGGHTQIALVHDFQKVEVLGQTQDDAAGEAFDKIAKYLGLGYPGGPRVDQLAKGGNPKAFHFPIPHAEGYHFSFSGFKTAVLYLIQKEMQLNPMFIQQHLSDLCASVQWGISEILFRKFEDALKRNHIKNMVLCGGVAANSEIRKRFCELGDTLNIKPYIPDFQFCTDNAGMIGVMGYYKFMEEIFADEKLVPFARKHSVNEPVKW
jgi:N6-L-threonylcarbamoyladenine synthase